VRGRLRRLLRHDKGATAVEYGLIAALMVLAMLAGLNAFAGRTNEIWSDVSSNVTEATS